MAFSPEQREKATHRLFGARFHPLRLGHRQHPEQSPDLLVTDTRLITEDGRTANMRGLLLEDAVAREKLGQAAREFAEGMGWEAVLDSLTELCSCLADVRRLSEGDIPEKLGFTSPQPLC